MVYCAFSSHSVHLAQKLFKAHEGSRSPVVICIHVTRYNHTALPSKIARSFSLPVFIMWEKPVFSFNETCCSSLGGEEYKSIEQMEAHNSRRQQTHTHTHTHTHLCSVYRRANRKGHKIKRQGQGA